MRLGNVITVNPESIRSGYSFDEIEYIDISLSFRKIVD